MDLAERRGMTRQEDVRNLVFEANMPPPPSLTAVSFPWFHTVHPLPSRFASKGSSAAETAIPQSSRIGVASGMNCCGKGGSLRRASRPVHELNFCSVFLSLLPLPSVISQPCPSLLAQPSRSLAFLNPHAQSPCLHSSSSRSPLPS